MAYSIIERRGLLVVDPTTMPGDGGEFVNYDFYELGDRTGHNYTGAGRPSANDDSAGTAGNGIFQTLSTWITTDESPRLFWVCLDSTPTKAVWIDVSSGGGSPGGVENSVQYRSAAGAFAGLPTFVFDPATGYLGIGVAVPGKELDIKGDQNGGSAVRIVNASTGTNSSAYVAVGENTNLSNMGRLGHTAQSYVQQGGFRPGQTYLVSGSLNQNGMVIMTRGNVGGTAHIYIHTGGNALEFFRGLMSATGDFLWGADETQLPTANPGKTIVLGDKTADPTLAAGTAGQWLNGEWSWYDPANQLLRLSQLRNHTKNQAGENLGIQAWNGSALQWALRTLSKASGNIDVYLAEDGGIVYCGGKAQVPGGVVIGAGQEGTIVYSTRLEYQTTSALGHWFDKQINSYGTMNCRQSADSQGVFVYGFDEQSGANVRLNISSAGHANVFATGWLYITSAAGRVTIQDGGGLGVWIGSTASFDTAAGELFLRTNGDGTSGGLRMGSAGQSRFYYDGTKARLTGTDLEVPDGKVLAQDFEYTSPLQVANAIYPLATPGGQTSASPVEFSSGVLGYEHAKNQDQGLWFTDLLNPDGIDLNYDLHIFIVWTYTGAMGGDTIEWGIEGSHINVGEAIPAPVTVLSGPVQASNSIPVTTEIVLDLAALAGQIAGFSFKIFRNRSGANDTLNQDIHSLAFYSVVSSKKPQTFFR